MSDLDATTDDDEPQLNLVEAGRQRLPDARVLQPKAAQNAPIVEVVQSTTEDERSAPTADQDSTRSEARDLWSSDENFGAALKVQKEKESRKRKRAAASTRRAKAAERAATTGHKRAKKDGRGRPRKQEKNWGDESDDDELMENTLPDYLQQRRANFDRRYEKLKEIGLKLPPTYDEVDFSDDERLEELHERPDFPRGAPSAEYKDKHLPMSLGVIPASIAQWLRDYQVDGTAFLHRMFVYQTGGILGDDMGLGKTVQVIAFLTAAFGKTGDERDNKRMRKMRRAKARWYPKVLVICPGTLIENWKNEFTRWGWWHVDTFHGQGKDEILDAASAGRLEIMITTYSTYRLNKESINMVNWDCVVADECHQIKARSSEITQAMNDINALCRIGLTGTAIQNSYDELWTLLNWTNPGKLGPITTWKQSISIPLKAGQSHDATVGQLARARQVAKKLVNNLLPQLFLRRTKSLIAHQLPKKSDRVVFCPLTQMQTEAYDNLIQSDAVRCIKIATTPCDCGSGKKSGWCCHTHINDDEGGPWRNYVFPYIIHLMKVCNHVATLIPQSSDNKDRANKNLEALQVALPNEWRQLYKTRDNINNFVNPDFCGKWKVLRRLLRFWHDNGDKVLVFSLSVRLLRILQKLFSMTAYNFSYLDGTMKYEDRAKIVDDFNSDPDQFVFLISTRAGGVGLNLTAANKVVVFDPSWNPAHDLQAQDRAYRIGQTRDVEVFRLICTGTIEEIIYARQIYKQQQANIGYTASHERRYFKGVQDEKDQKGEIFGLINMFTFQEDRVVLRDIVNNTNVAESKAGVSIADIELSDTQSSVNDSFMGDAAKSGDEAYMSQLASQLIDEAETIASESQKSDTRKSRKGKGIAATGTAEAENHNKAPRKPDPVSAILASAGVEYTHFNSEVVGSSKIESSLSRRAEETGKTAMEDEHVFARNTQDRAEPPSNHVAGPTTTATGSGEADDPFDLSEDETAVNRIAWRYRPPAEVKERQLAAMAEMFGFDDPVEFASIVEGWTQAQRRDCLDRYYAARRRALGIGVKKKVVDGVTGKETDERQVKGDEGGEAVEAEGPNIQDMVGTRSEPDEEPWEL